MEPSMTILPQNMLYNNMLRHVNARICIFLILSLSSPHFPYLLIIFLIFLIILFLSRLDLSRLDNTLYLATLHLVSFCLGVLY